jgi:hypothetical protein
MTDKNAKIQPYYTTNVDESIKSGGNIACHCEPFAPVILSPSPVILSAAKNLNISFPPEILRSLCSLRMTEKGTEIATSLTLLAMTERKIYGVSR